MKKNRDYRIDILRSIAIFLIILAHVKPNNVVFNIRNFDVVMMVFVSGASFSLSSKMNFFEKREYLSYVVKRFKRLILPAWVFVTIFFCFFIFVFQINRQEIPFNWKVVVTSYSLVSGIGYVWIIRVLFCISILNPWLSVLNEKFLNLSKFLCMIIVLIFVQFLLVRQSDYLTGVQGILVKVIFEQITGYSIIGLVGMRLVNVEKKSLLKITAIFFLITISIPVFKILLNKGFSTDFVNLQLFKYPPQPFYLLYGLTISTFLLGIFDNIKINKKIKQIILWISTNSLPIYYWHIFPIEYLHYFSNNLFGTNWIVKYIVIIAIAIILTVIQNKLLPNLFSGSLKRVWKK